MADLNLIKIIEEFSSTKLTKVELSSQMIKKKGLYELNNGAYFLLYPNYLNEDEKSKLCEASNKFEFKPLHKNRDTFYIGPQYSYGKSVHPVNDVWDKTMLKTKAKLELMLESPFNSVLVNRYEVGQLIPFHKDNEPCLGDKPVIASLSIGDTGKMTIKDENDNMAEVLIYPGTLLVMFGNFNKSYVHQVKRTTENKKYRTNFTFRYIFSTDKSAPSSYLATPTVSPTTKTTSTNNKVILLKPATTRIASSSDASTSSDSTAAATPIPKSAAEIINHLNSVLPEETNVNESDIQVEDYSDKNGPVIVEFKTLKQKVNVLRSFKSKKDIIVRDCLSYKSNSLRKKAIQLMNKGVIKKVWTFRGDVYFLLPVGGRGVKADRDNLDFLSRLNPILPPGDTGSG